MRQSQHLLSRGNWSLALHSVTFFNVPIMDELVELSTNLIQPNQSNERDIIYSGQAGWSWEKSQPLALFPVRVKQTVPGRDGVRRVVHTSFNNGGDSPRFKINRPKDKLEFHFSPKRDEKFPPAFLACRSVVHASLYRD